MNGIYNKLIIILGVLISGLVAYLFIFDGNSIKEIKLDKNELELYIGKKAQLTSTIVPEKLKDEKIIWKSENPLIAKVNDKGLVEAIKDGETKIVVSDTDEKISSSCKVKVLPIEVEKIEISESDLILNIGDKKTIVGKVIPENATYPSISYISSNKNVVTVDENGKVKAVGKGKAIITLKSSNGILRNCNVEVIADLIEVSLNKNSITLAISDSKELVASITPSNVNSKITWSSSDENVAKVDSNGKVKAIGTGKAVIKAKISNGSFATCDVTVISEIINVKEISLDKTNVTLHRDETETLKATIVPSDATDKTLTWTSSDNNIASVSNGKITPKKTGKVTITVKSNNGKSAIATINVVNNTYQKKAIFFGDSITQGKYGNYSWANYIGEKYDLKSSVNAGISGGVVSSFRGTSWIVDVVKKYKAKKYDYVIMHGGLNDIALAVRLGEKLGSYKKTNFSGKYDTSTFIGGLETYIYTVKKQWPNAKLGYIINYKTPNDSTVIQKDKEFYSKLMEVLRKWDVSYINLFSGKAPNGKKYSDILKVTSYKYIQDGNHLNVAGYKVISPYIYEWMNTL